MKIHRDSALKGKDAERIWCSMTLISTYIH